MGEILMLVGAGILVFGAKRLPQLGKSLGESINAFKKGIKGEEDKRKVRDVNSPPNENGEKDS